MHNYYKLNLSLKNLLMLILPVACNAMKINTNIIDASINIIPPPYLHYRI